MHAFQHSSESFDRPNPRFSGPSNRSNVTDARAERIEQSAQQNMVTESARADNDYTSKDVQKAMQRVAVNSSLPSYVVSESVATAQPCAFRRLSPGPRAMLRLEREKASYTLRIVSVAHKGSNTLYIVSASARACSLSVLFQECRDRDVLGGYTRSGNSTVKEFESPRGERSLVLQVLLSSCR